MVANEFTPTEPLIQGIISSTVGRLCQAPPVLDAVLQHPGEEAPVTGSSFARASLGVVSGFFQDRLR